MDRKPFIPNDKIVMEKGTFRWFADYLYEAGVLVGEIRDRINAASVINSNADYQFKEAATRARKLARLLDSLSLHVADIDDQK